MKKTTDEIIELALEVGTEFDLFENNDWKTNKDRDRAYSIVYNRLPSNIEVK